ncbi:FG-GAP-like repeat-containing protein [Nocardioides pakistanensis]
MAENKSRFVLVCQQLLAVGTVAALAAPALGVATLDIVGPAPRQEGAAAQAVPAVALVASAPVEPTVTAVPLEGVERAGLTALARRPATRREAASELAALSAPEAVEGYATVGVTWDHAERLEEDQVSVSVRSRDGDGWGPWQEIEYHDDHGPDPDSAEARMARQGTDPIVVGDVDQVQVKVETDDGEVPAGAELVVVDPQETPGARVETPAIDTADLPEGGAITLSSSTTGAWDGTEGGTGDPEPTTDPTAETPVPDGTVPDGTDPDGLLTGAVGITPKPQIFSRAQWGADERLRNKRALSYYEVHAGYVHHTVNANNYTRAQVPALLRGIYAYHTKAKGWSDIGYNFIVDRFGRIWEGRYGGVDRPVVGAHTLGYNEYSFAMSALGNFDKARPSAAMLDAYGRLFAWKLSLHGVSAASSQQWVGKKYFPAINGHRDAGRTACPGKYLYAQLPQIKGLAASYQAPFTSRTRSVDIAGSPWPDLVVRDSETKAIKVLRTGGQTNFQQPTFAVKGWKGMDLIAASRDLTGDQIPDLLARNRATGSTGLYPGTAQGTFGAAVMETDRFAEVDQLVAAGDLTGDGEADVVARTRNTTELWVYPGTGRGAFRQRQLLSRDWDYDLTAGVADLDGDGRDDLVARRSTRLYLVPGTGRGLGAATVMPGRWAAFTLISGAGDLDLDGENDLLVKTRRSRQVFIIPGDGAGGLSTRLGPFLQFRGMNMLAAAGQLAGDGAADLVGRDAMGRIRVYPHNGAKNVEALQDTGLAIPDANLILNVGDWNNDGYADLMSRGAGGAMSLWPGTGQGRFTGPLPAGRGWARVQLVAAVGDITGDGYPDLMGQPRGRAMRIYPGNGATGFLPSYVAHSAISSNGHAGLGLWDADGSPDSLLRRTDGTLVLYRGNGPGGLFGPSTVGKGAGRFDWLQAVGDATGDSRPDVVARDRRTGTLYLLAGTPKGFTAPRLLAEGFATYDLSS